MFSETGSYFVPQGEAGLLEASGGGGAGSATAPVIATWEGQIVAVGPRREVEASLDASGYQLSRFARLDARGGLITPGLIDAHTHLLFAGSRENELLLRQQGAGYLEILAAGGGILSTVAATRAASAEELSAHGRAWLDEMLGHGATTVEAKSGYGLDLATERRLLEVAIEIGREGPVGVVPIAILGTNRPVITPPTVPLADAKGTVPATGEKYEGMLVRIAGATSLTTAIPGTPFDISQSLAGADTFMVDDLAVDEAGYTPWRGDIVDVTGIIRYSGTAPFRRIQPRKWSEPPTGDIHVVSKANASDAPPPAYRTELLQNRPNPFNPTTEIAFTLAAEAPVTLRVYTVDGRLVRTLYQGVGSAGPNRFAWDEGEALPLDGLPSPLERGHESRA